jgi:WD40 repeat protein
MHIAHSENLMVSGHNDSSIKVWDLNNREMIVKLEDHADKVCCVRFTPDEKHIVSTSKDDTIKIWDVRSKKVLHSFENDMF